MPVESASPVEHMRGGVRVNPVVDVRVGHAEAPVLPLAVRDEHSVNEGGEDDYSRQALRGEFRFHGLKTQKKKTIKNSVPNYWGQSVDTVGRFRHCVRGGLLEGTVAEAAGEAVSIDAIRIFTLPRFAPLYISEYQAVCDFPLAG